MSHGAEILCCALGAGLEICAGLPLNSPLLLTHSPGFKLMRITFFKQWREQECNNFRCRSCSSHVPNIPAGLGHEGNEEGMVLSVCWTHEPLTPFLMDAGHLGRGCVLWSRARVTSYHCFGVVGASNTSPTKWLLLGNE